MVNLPTVPNNGPALVQAPQSRVSGRDIEALGSDTASALQGGAKLADDAAVPFAQVDGQQYGQAQTARAADGNVQVNNVPEALYVGRSAQVFDQTAQMAARANLQTNLHNDLQNLAVKTMQPSSMGGGDGDPTWFQKQAHDLIIKTASQQRNGLQFDVQQMGNSIAGDYWRGLVGQKAAIDGQEAKNTFDNHISMLQQDLSDLAAQGGTNSPMFAQKAAQLDAYRKQMLADPRMHYTQAQYEADTRSDTTNMEVQGVIGDARRQAEASGDYFTPIRQAEEKLQSIPMDPAKRIQMLGEVTRHLGSASAVRGAQIKELTDQSDGMAKSIYDTGNVDDTAVNDMVSKLMVARSPAAAIRLEAARKFAQVQPAILQGTAQQAADTAQSIMQAANTGAPLPSTSLMNQPYTGQAQMTAQQVFDLAKHEVQAQGLVGTVPIDGPKYGIKTGSAAEWAAFMTRISNAESSYNNGDTYTEDFKHDGKNVVSRGLYSLSEHDAATYGLNGGQYFTPEQLANPNLNTASAVAIIKKLVGQGGTIEGNVGQYWSTVRDGAVLKDNTPMPADNASAAPLGGVNADIAMAGYKDLVSHTQALINGRTETLWNGMKSAWDAGNQPTPQEIADLKTLIPYVSKPELRQEMATRLNAQVTASGTNVLPALQQQDLAASAKLAAQAGQLGKIDRETAVNIEQASKARMSMLKDSPVDYASRYLGNQPAQPLDMSSPTNFKSSLDARQSLFNVTKQAEPTAGNNPLTSTDRTQIASALPALRGDQAGQMLTTLNSSLKPEQMKAVMADDGIKNAVIGLTRSADPSKMQAGYSFLDALNRQNPIEFSSMFGSEVEKGLHSWQTKTQFQPADVAAKQMLQANDPSTAKANEVRATAAEDLLKPATSSQIVSKVQAHPWFSWVPGVGAGSPVSDTAAMSPDEMLSDYRQAFKQSYMDNGDQTAADKFAVQQLAKKWGVSPTNGGRIMAYPPEKYVQPIDGNYNWMRDQLTNDLRQHFGQEAAADSFPDLENPSMARASTDAEATAQAKVDAPKALVADAKTQADISAGRPPSYRIIVQDTNGQFHMIADDKGNEFRWRPDRDAALSQAETDFRSRDSIVRSGLVQRNREFMERGGPSGTLGNLLTGFVIGGGM